MAVTLTFFKFQRIIQVDSPQTSASIQDLLNEIRNYEALLINLDYGHITNAYGKQSLGGGVTVGITLELINDWRIAFEARAGPSTTLCTVSGGNLVAINQYSNNPISPTAFTQVNIAQSTSASIIQPDSDYTLLYLLESLLGKQKSAGSYFYWNPTSGSDTNDGTTPAKAVATFAQAQTLATAGAGDTIFCVASATSGTTTVTQTLNITKANLKLRGPGHTFQLIPTTTTDPTIQIAADNVEISGLFISTAASGSQNAITVTGDNANIQDSWIANARATGIDISSSKRTRVANCVIEHCGTSGTGNGITLGNTTTEALISKCIIFDNVNGVALSGTGIADNVLENNLIYQHSSYGVTVGSGVLRTHVRSGHTFNKNTAGNTQDLGTDTLIESQAGGASASEIADAVWDEVISGHATAGTTGRTLNDAKKRATLASLQ
ncbi:right-handed parallel beta-helix repeat-containing protein [Candidatus Microgenomates bacterium]|nr:right-handed parallel beta-helix repeat-containing protein [Candidatus Microgenomates bacterium]